jgi:hypothetical protein
LNFGDVHFTGIIHQRFDDKFDQVLHELLLGPFLI